jgi:hypothetical protein
MVNGEFPPAIRWCGDGGVAYALDSWNMTNGAASLGESLKQLVTGLAQEVHSVSEAFGK